MKAPSPISIKTNRVLKGILILLALISIRIWQLAIFQKDEHETKAAQPQRRSILIPSQRGTIHDRYGKGLALNRICYNACIYYSHISEIPRIRWVKNSLGKKEKVWARKAYIEDLSHKLSDVLALDTIHIEDEIHSKASLLPNIPYIIKKNITENEYYRLRMLQRNYPGLYAEITSERFYPYHECSSHLLGYMGAIGFHEFVQIAEEIKTLERSLPTLSDSIDAEKSALRFKELKEKAYNIRDFVGKSGIEAKFENTLRGFYGQKTFEVDIKGNFLKEIEGSKKPIPGKKILLSISYDLQKYAEDLLSESETIREGKSRVFDPIQKKMKEQKQPWIKGGAIVAMDPNTAEILAFATHPNFDPNDYIQTGDHEEKKQKQHSIHKCLESETYIEHLWNGEKFLERKHSETEEQLRLSWEAFLDFILPKEHEIHTSLQKIQTIKNAIDLQEAFSFLLYYSTQNNPSYLIDVLFPKEDKAKLAAPFIPEDVKTMISLKIGEKNALQKKCHFFLENISDNKDKLFLIDLCSLAVCSPSFSDELIEKVQDMSLCTYHDLKQEMYALEEGVKEFAKPIFHEDLFMSWRAKNMTSYLKEKRAEEKKKRTYARPYVEYLDQKEKEMFSEFWKKNRFYLMNIALKGKEGIFEKNEDLDLFCTYFILKHEEFKNKSKIVNLRNLANKFDSFSLFSFLKTIRYFKDLDRPLYFQSSRYRGKKGVQTEKHLASSFYPITGFGYGRSYAYRQNTPLGSIFKLVTAYAALSKKSKESPLTLEQLNPLEIIDEVRWDSKIGKKGGIVVGYTLNGKPYPRYYKGGRLPRSYHTRMGKIDLIKALEHSSNPYFSLLAGDFLDHPEELLDTCRSLGFGKKTGIDLTGEIAGNLPNDLEKNKTGLYSFAIGQHSLIATPLQTALMMSSFVNGGFLFKPKIITNILGNERSDVCWSIDENYDYKDELFQLGFHFPVFTELSKKEKPISSHFPTEIQKRIFITPLIRKMLIKGMHQVVSGEKGTARPSIIKGLLQKPQWMQKYKELTSSFIGKTSTTEIMVNPYMHPSSKAEMYKHVWFGGISFRNQEKRAWADPELVVIVFLQYADGGKEAAPLAMKIIEKYREIESH